MQLPYSLLLLLMCVFIFVFISQVSTIKRQGHVVHSMSGLWKLALSHLLVWGRLSAGPPMG
jgi:hypothetical protein